MKKACVTPVGLRRTVFAAAIALVLSGPASAADTNSKASQYDSAVTYSDYRGQQGDYKLRASDLIGRDVQNAKDDEIGEIDDLIVSRDGDKVMAIISLGGFLDFDSKLVAIPYQDLRVTRDGDHVYYNATKDELLERSAFSYDEGERPQKNTPMKDKMSAVDGRQLGATAKADMKRSTADTPGLAADGTAVNKAKPADNSTHNKRDVTSENLTPLDQSNTAADVDITRTIRKALVDDDSLGMNAQNVKVITVDGVVTLRGAVASANEQARIVAIAKEAAGLDRVQSELKVIQR